VSRPFPDVQCHNVFLGIVIMLIQGRVEEKMNM